MSSSPTSARERRRIAPDWTLGQLKETFPGVELALYAFFGVGSRERAGFSAAERLEDLLRRHLVFDAERACARLDALAAEDWSHEISARELKSALDREALLVIDARSAAEHALARLPDSRLLSAESVAALRARPEVPAVLVCNDGSQAPAASRHLRGLGLAARHLRGGLAAWAIDSDESFPINYPLMETPGRWHLIADGQTLRYRRPEPRPQSQWRVWSRPALLAHPRLAELGEALPQLEMAIWTPRSFALRGAFTDHTKVIALALPWLEEGDLWDSGGEASEVVAERTTLERVLALEAPAILQSHKGTVEVREYVDRVLTLQLGGGCSGCASASVTTQRELAAALYRAVPLLDRIQNAE